jgi:hypothetical protein
MYGPFPYDYYFVATCFNFEDIVLGENVEASKAVEANNVRVRVANNVPPGVKEKFHHSRMTMLLQGG